MDGRRRVRVQREGEGAERAGCDFNMCGSQSHYRLQSEEHRGQT